MVLLQPTTSAGLPELQPEVLHQAAHAQLSQFGIEWLGSNTLARQPQDPGILVSIVHQYEDIEGRKVSESSEYTQVAVAPRAFRIRWIVNAFNRRGVRADGNIQAFVRRHRTQRCNHVLGSCVQEVGQTMPARTRRESAGWRRRWCLGKDSKDSENDRQDFKTRFTRLFSSAQTPKVIAFQLARARREQEVAGILLQRTYPHLRAGFVGLVHFDSTDTPLVKPLII
jgi:hypothetical protein